MSNSKMNNARRSIGLIRPSAMNVGVFRATASRFVAAALLCACSLDAPEAGDRLSAQVVVSKVVKTDGPARQFVHPGSNARALRAQYSHVGPAAELPKYAIEEGVTFAEDGRVTKTSGVVEVRVREMSADERAEKLERKPPVTPDFDTSRTKIGEGLAEWMAKAQPEERTRVLMSVAEPEYPGIQSEFEAAVERGEVRSADDAEMLDAILIEELAAMVSEAQEPVLTEVAAMGGKVIVAHSHLFGLDAHLTAAMIERLASMPDVLRMDADSVGVSLALVTGSQVIAGTQIKQLITTGNDGSYGAPNIRVAMIDQHDYHDEHPGFKDSGGVGTRIAGRYTCSAALCSSIANFPVPAAGAPEHATNMAGVLFGDLRDGQDPAYPGAGTAAQIERSGYAGEAWAYLYKLNNGTASQAIMAYDSIIARNPRPRVVSSVIGFNLDDPACLGDSVLNQRANDLYEAGILLVQSGGNVNHPIANCTVFSPGSSIGAFTVGYHGIDWNGTEVDVRQAALNVGSPRGGVSLAEGEDRTIIDMTAFAGRGRLYDRLGDYVGSAQGSSVAGATVASAAVDFIDFYKVFNGGSAFIDNPGVVFVNLLLMGDRQNQLGKSVSVLDNVWGAGRLKMRKADAAGLDAPAVWKTGSVCVEEGEVVSIPVNGGVALNADVDDFKAVIYWYDRQHVAGISIDDVDLALVDEATDSNIVVSASVSDEKERVYHPAIGATAVRLDISGYTINSDAEGCGVDSMRVYYAYFYEDDDRDDIEGPTLSAVDPE